MDAHLPEETSGQAGTIQKGTAMADPFMEQAPAEAPDVGERAYPQDALRPLRVRWVSRARYFGHSGEDHPWRPILRGAIPDRSEREGVGRWGIERGNRRNFSSRSLLSRT